MTSVYLNLVESMTDFYEDEKKRVPAYCPLTMCYTFSVLFWFKVLNDGDKVVDVLAGGDARGDFEGKRRGFICCPREWWVGVLARDIYLSFSRLLEDN